jgi:hypothetical protein
MSSLIRLYSYYLEFLIGLGQARNRLLFILFCASIVLFWFGMRDHASLWARVLLFGSAGSFQLAVLGGMLALAVRDTLFVRGWKHVDPDQSPHPLEPGQGLPGRVTGLFSASRFSQQMVLQSGGVLLDDAQLHLVVPARSFQIIGGITPKNCLDWWRRTLEPDGVLVEVGTLWVGGKALPALRFHDRDFGALTLSMPDQAAFARVIETLRQQRFALV